MSDPNDQTNPGGPVDADPDAVALRRVEKKLDRVLKIAIETYEEVVALQPRVTKLEGEVARIKARLLLDEPHTEDA